MIVTVTNINGEAQSPAVEYVITPSMLFDAPTENGAGSVVLHIKNGSNPQTFDTWVISETLSAVSNGLVVKGADGADGTDGYVTISINNLASGTYTFSGASFTGVTASSKVTASRLDKRSSTAIGSLEAKPGTNQIVVTSLKSDATTETGDASSVLVVVHSLT